MAKVILEFDKYEDAQEIKMQMMAGEMHLALSEIANKIRHYRKYDDREAIPTEELSQAILDLFPENFFS